MHCNNKNWQKRESKLSWRFSKGAKVIAITIFRCAEWKVCSRCNQVKWKCLTKKDESDGLTDIKVFCLWSSSWAELFWTSIVCGLMHLIVDYKNEIKEKVWQERQLKWILNSWRSKQGHLNSFETGNSLLRTCASPLEDRLPRDFRMKSYSSSRPKSQQDRQKARSSRMNRL
jgi:hypothetical protein